MEPVDPRVDPALMPAHSVARVIAEHQIEYRDLPSVITPRGEVITRWTLSDAERAAVLRGEDVYVTIVGVPIRPFYVTIGPVDWSR